MTDEWSTITDNALLLSIHVVVVIQIDAQLFHTEKLIENVIFLCNSIKK